MTFDLVVLLRKQKEEERSEYLIAPAWSKQTEASAAAAAQLVGLGLMAFDLKEVTQQSKEEEDRYKHH